MWVELGNKKFINFVTFFFHYGYGGMGNPRTLPGKPIKVRNLLSLRIVAAMITDYDFL